MPCASPSQTPATPWTTPTSRCSPCMSDPARCRLEHLAAIYAVYGAETRRVIVINASPSVLPGAVVLSDRCCRQESVANATILRLTKELAFIDEVLAAAEANQLRGPELDYFVDRQGPPAVGLVLGRCMWDKCKCSAPLLQYSDARFLLVCSLL